MLFDSEMTHDKPYVRGIRYSRHFRHVFIWYFTSQPGLYLMAKLYPLKSNEYLHAYKYISYAV